MNQTPYSSLNYNQAIDQIRSTFDFDFVALSLVPLDDRPILTWQYASGNLNERYKRIVLNTGHGVVGKIYQTARPMIIADVNHEIPADEMHEYPIIIAEALGSLVGFPLWKNGAIKAILLAGFRYVQGVNEELLERLKAHLSPSFLGFTINEEVEPPERFFDRQDDERPVYELMTHRILEAQEKERRRISRELHDGISQDLLGIQMLLRQVRYAESLEEKDDLAKHAVSSLDSVFDDIRRMALALRPSSLDDLGLEATLEMHANSTSINFGVHVQFSSNIGEERFRQPVETVVYRICQEAVMNACKYSHADNILVTLHQKEDHLVLTVQDEGTGFDQENLTVLGTGLGLEGMKERAELIDGTVSIESTPGEGTRISLVVPLASYEIPPSRSAHSFPSQTAAAGDSSKEKA